jgi:hypothetical protein
MSVFTIHGAANSPQLAYSLAIARHLKLNLPAFKYEAKLFTPEDWIPYIVQLQRLYGFNHSACPTILEEGRLVGGLSQWRELVCLNIFFLLFFRWPKDMV